MDATISHTSFERGHSELSADQGYLDPRQNVNKKLTDEELEDPKNYNYIENVFENGKIDRGELKKAMGARVPDATDSEVSDIIAEFDIALRELAQVQARNPVSEGNQTDSGNPWTLGIAKIYMEDEVRQEKFRS